MKKSVPASSRTFWFASSVLVGILLLAGAFFFISHSTASGIPRFTRAVRDGGVNDESGFTEAVASDGSVYEAGSFVGTTTIAGQSVSAASSAAMDGFLAKYAADGTPQWARTVTGGDGSQVNAVAAASDGSVYVTGFYYGTATFGGATSVTSSGSGDVFLAKYAADGTFQWVRVGGSSGGTDGGEGLAFDASGNVYDAGFFGGTSATFDSATLTSGPSSGSKHWLLLKYQPDGTLVYAKDIGGGTDGDAFALTLAVDDSDAYVSGYNLATDASFAGTTVGNNGNSDIVVAKYALNGAGVWASSVGSSGDDVANQIIALNGAVYVAGYTGGAFAYGPNAIAAAGGTDAVFAKYEESDGTVDWARQIAGIGDDRARAAVALGGNLYVSGDFSNSVTVGSTTLTSAGGTDPFLISYTPGGGIRWALQGGGSGNVLSARGCGLNGTSIVCGGFFDGTLSFGNFSLTSAGGRDLYVDTVQEFNTGQVSILPQTVPTLAFTARQTANADGATNHVVYQAVIADHVPVYDVYIDDAACPGKPVLQSGDADGDGILQSGETWIFACDVSNRVPPRMPILYAEGGPFLVSLPAASL